MPEHDPAVEEELFARLAAEMGPFLETTNRREHLAVFLRLALVVAGLVAVVAGLSRSVVISAAGYTVALFALVSLGSHVGSAWGRARRAGRVLRQRLR
ncbi:MAG: hypothetical protein ACXWBN_04415 [Acidimicrobiales bacterium]